VKYHWFSASFNDTIETSTTKEIEMLNTRLVTLELIFWLSKFNKESIGSLMCVMQLKEAQIKRYIKEARKIGAEIESSNKGGFWTYQLKNKEMIEKKLNIWLELERNECLVSA
jgi:hypothetical protein